MPDHETAEQDTPPQGDDLRSLAAETAADARGFIGAVREIAASGGSESLPLLLLVLSQVQVTGARLGAIQDVVPVERFEPDPGTEPDQDALRTSLANVLDGIDDYADLVDPVTSVELSRGSISDDLAETVVAFNYGLAHYDQGRVVEALWWWQFSYLSDWGMRSAASLRALVTLLAHVRLDVDDETASEAEFNALHP